MWYHTFTWCILSALVLHIIAALIAFCRLHPHRLSRICPILLLVFPMLTAIVCGSITGARLSSLFQFWSSTSLYSTIHTRTALNYNATLHSHNHSLQSITRFPLCCDHIALVVKVVHELIDVDMSPIWACFWGLGQTLFTTILNFHRFSSLL